MVLLIPWKRSEIVNLRSRMETLFDHFFDDLSHRCLINAMADTSDWRLMERGDHLLMEVDLPGLSPQDIEVSLSGTLLAIRTHSGAVTGTKQDAAACGSAYSASMRSVRLPCRVAQEGVTARYEGGVLTIVLPKAETTVHVVRITE